MNGKKINFGDKKKESDFYKKKKISRINYIDAIKMLVSKKES